MSNIWTGNNRAPWHDYRSRQIYHITLKKHPDAPYFGHISGDWHLPAGTPGSPFISASPLGKIIKDCLRTLHEIHPSLHLFQYTLMPDHLHMIISVEGNLDEILGRKIAIFKVRVNSQSGLPHVFDRGFNDQLLKSGRSLDQFFNYLRQNPYRLAVRFANPEFFTRRNNLIIGGNQYQAYGNMHFIENPFKAQVLVHRSYSPDQLARKKEIWLHTAANGGILVSPFVSRAEKDVRAEAEALGAKFIIITHEAFGDRFKPSAHDFALCSEGRLVLISLGLSKGLPLTRGVCLRMNELAKAVVNDLAK